MHRRDALRALLAAPVAARASVRADTDVQPTGEWVSLFNGKDLSGWETFLGKPHPTVDVHGVPRNATGEYLQALGIDTDPQGVFSVVDIGGAPAIRISGEIYGALTTRREFGDYHLRFEFRWGEKRWPPRANAIRDSGCCYHAVPPHGASYGFWMRSCEFQIQEGECGDFYSLAGVIVDAEAVRLNPSDPKSEFVYTPGAPPLVGHTKRIVKSGTYERPRGEWNTLELYCLGQRSVHVVNGEVNMRLSGIRQPAGSAALPLPRGRIQLQSEGAEVFYRNLSIRTIRDLPREIAGM
jgi:hypothetical protein